MMSNENINADEHSLSEVSSEEKTRAFNRYMKEGRDDIREKKSSLSTSQIKSLLVKNWQVMTGDEKNEWVAGRNTTVKLLQK